MSKYSPVYKQALAMQRLTHKQAVAPDTEPSTLCELAKTFISLEMLKLRLRMKPAPKPIDTTKIPVKPTTKPAESFSESGVS